MPLPINKKQLQSFTGKINYLSKFSSRLSELAELIRVLSKDKVPFNWNLNITKLLHRWRKKLQVLLFSHTITPKSQLLCRQMPVWKVLMLVYYKMQNQCILQARFSLILRKVMLAIELESLTVAWVMEKFHHFLYASHFLLVTDQIPLEAILSKSIAVDTY